ncbi:MAG: hypothetical protein K8R48_01210 [Alphaproteobacteria bacterium]|nr:hypothetical protein [Alphaproteobacteria bacterium]
MTVSKDWIQIPRPHFDDELSACIAAGDCRRVRELFDQAFWDEYKIFLTWEHLKSALVHEDKPMLKLLVTWGATATEASLAQLWSASGSKYPRYLKLLRQCGVRIPAAAAALPLSEPPAPEADMIAMVPEEWKKVLQALHDAGAEEAMIAGGALRDLFNNRAIKDVDIFLQPRGSENDNKIFLKEVFRKAGLAVAGQSDYSTSYFSDEAALPSAEKGQAFLVHRLGPYATVINYVSESWTVIAGPQKTEYNIIFVGKPGLLAATELIEGFDVGLCRIAYNGAKIITSAGYDSDVQNRRITLLLPNNTSSGHLQRIAKKYPDWELCAKAKKLLAPEPKRGFWLGGSGCNTGMR